MPQSAKASRPDRLLRRTAPWGIQVGKMDGTPTTGDVRPRTPPPARSRAPCSGGPDLEDYSTPLTGRVPAPGASPPRSRGVGGRDPGHKIVTWLILPVVICLSQRLSHACLSISNYTVKLRMAH